jgi:hypothetical protein
LWHSKILKLNLKKKIQNFKNHLPYINGALCTWCKKVAAYNTKKSIIYNFIFFGYDLKLWSFLTQCTKFARNLHIFSKFIIIQQWLGKKTCDVLRQL